MAASGVTVSRNGPPPALALPLVASGGSTADSVLTSPTTDPWLWGTRAGHFGHEVGGLLPVPPEPAAAGLTITRVPGGPELEPPYVAVRQLAAGSFGVAWLARNPADGHTIVVKVSRAEVSADALQEAEVLKALPGHPYIIGYLGHSVVDGRLHLKLEYAENGDLAHAVSKMVADGRWSWQDAVLVVGQVAAAVAHAHGQPHPVIHRDIKPANVLVGAGHVMKLADFGLAKPTAALETAMHSRALVGTLLYMAPEVRETSNYSAAADVWSLGVMLHCLLLQMAGEATGACSPFVHTDPAKRSPRETQTHLAHGHTFLTRLPVGTPFILRCLLAWMLSLVPAERPSAAQVRDALMTLHAADPPLPTPRSPDGRMQPTPSFYALPTAGGAAPGPRTPALQYDLTAALKRHNSSLARVPGIPGVDTEHLQPCLQEVVPVALRGDASGTITMVHDPTVLTPMALVEQAAGERFGILAGAPGAGKTLLLESLAYSHAAGKRHGLANPDALSAYKRVVVVKVGGLADAVGALWAESATVGEVATRLIMAQAPAVAAAITSPALAAVELFHPHAAAETLWLIDGVSEVGTDADLLADLLQLCERRVSDWAASPTAGLPAARDRLRPLATHAVLRLLLTQKHVLVSCRPGFAARLRSPHVWLKDLPPHAVDQFVADAFGAGHPAHESLSRHMGDDPELKAIMAQPRMLLLVVEAHAAAISGAGAADAARRASSIVDVFRHLERHMLGRLLATSGELGASPHAWLEYCLRAGRLAIASVAAGSCEVAWPDDSMRRDFQALALLRPLGADRAEFSHVCWRDYFAAFSLTMALEHGFVLNTAMRAALGQPGARLFRRLVMGMLTDQAKAEDVAVYLLEAGGVASYKPTDLVNATPAALAMLDDSVSEQSRLWRTECALSEAFRAAMKIACKHLEDRREALPIFSNRAFWHIGSIIAPPGACKWAMERCDHFMDPSRWYVGKTSLKVLTALDVLAFTHYAAAQPVIQRATGSMIPEVRSRATVVSIMLGDERQNVQSQLTHILDAADTARDWPEAWRQLEFLDVPPTVLTRLAVTLLLRPTCPAELVARLQAAVNPKHVGTAELETLLSLPSVNPSLRRALLVEARVFRCDAIRDGLPFDESWTLQHVAAFAGRIDCMPTVSAVLASHVVCTSARWTLLHCAAAGGQADLVRAYACDKRMLHAVDTWGSSPHAVAIAFRRQEAFAALVDADPMAAMAMASHLWKLAAASLLKWPVSELAARKIPITDDALCDLVQRCSEVVVVGDGVVRNYTWLQHPQQPSTMVLHGVAWATSGLLHRLPVSLDRLEIRSCPGLRSPVPLARFQALKQLSLRGCIHVTIDDLRHVPPSLLDLDCTGCTGLTEAADPACLSHVTRLQSLSLDGCERVPDAVVLHLPPSIRTLGLHACDSLTPALRLAHLPDLASLDVSHTSWVKDSFVADLPRGLRQLNVSHCPRLTQRCSFAHFAALERLAMAGAQFHPASVLAAGSLAASLTHLDISEPVGMAGGAEIKLSAYASLTHLQASACPLVTDAVIVALPPTLTHLLLARCANMTAFVTFNHLPNLQVLSLAAVPTVTDALVAALPATLRELDVSGCTLLTAAVRFTHLTLLHPHKLRVDDTAAAAHVRARTSRSDAPSIRDFFAAIGDGARALAQQVRPRMGTSPAASGGLASTPGGGGVGGRR
jgi:serine/threonine protein kinase